MQILTGSRYEITMMQWEEQLSKAEKKLEDAKAVYERFGDEDDAFYLKTQQMKVDRIREDMERTRNNLLSGFKPTAASIAEQEERNRRRMNEDIDLCGMAYGLRDSDGNTFYFAGIENGLAVYRGSGGSKHITNLHGYEVIEQYA